MHILMHVCMEVHVNNYGLEFNIYICAEGGHLCVYVSMHACRYGVASFPDTPPPPLASSKVMQ